MAQEGEEEKEKGQVDVPLSPPSDQQDDETQGETGRAPSDDDAISTPLQEETAPVQREASRQISKAVKLVEREEQQKIRAAQLKRRNMQASMQNDDDNDSQEGDNPLFATMEDEEDAVLQKMVGEQRNEEKAMDEQVEEDEEEEEEEPIIHEQPDEPLGRSGVHTHTSRNNATSSRAVNKHKKRPVNLRTESVQQAMFGLDPAASNATAISARGSQTKSPHTKAQLQSSQMGDLAYDAPLAATEQLIATANAHVQRTQQQQTNGNLPPVQEVISNNGPPLSGRTALSSLHRMDEIVQDYSASSTNSNSSNDEHNDEEQPASQRQHQPRRRCCGGRKQQRQPSNPVLHTGIQEDWELFQQFWVPRRATFGRYLQWIVLLVVLPSSIVAALLFYVKEQYDDVPANENEAFVSWWFLFVGVRQVVTLTLALVTQALVIDYIALGSRISLYCFGPVVTLLAVQAKGWPFVLGMWALYDWILMSGPRPFSHHWGYWQTWITLFTDANHSGTIVESDLYYRILTLAMIIGAVVSVKRLLLGLFLATKTLTQFGEEFENVKKRMIVVGETATLAKEIEWKHRGVLLRLPSSGGDHQSVSTTNREIIQSHLSKYGEQRDEDASSRTAGPSPVDAAAAFVSDWRASTQIPSTQPTPNDAPDSFVQSLQDKEFDASDRRKISELLEEWEGSEERLKRGKSKKISVGQVLRFHKEITAMNRKYPFLPVFGRADTRERCISSAQKVFDRLLLRTPDLQRLPFTTVALLAKEENGKINPTRLRELIKIYRPDRDGKLSKLDFVKSIDAIYKSMRQLSINIHDWSSIDKAVTVLVDIIFYIALGSFVLQRLGVNPLQLFVSLSTLILGFTFMFASSASKYFEGMLFILVQRPYGVGDRIHLSSPSSETNPNGSSGWIVEKLTLSTTTLYWGATNERATISNGAISHLRIINAQRSPNAVVFIPMKFGIDTPYKKIQVFRAAAEQFLKDRPRQWAAFIGFRPSDVVVERGYIAYTLIAQHREGWQKIGAILSSKANLTTYLLEVTKQLGLRYVNPPVPLIHDPGLTGKSMAEALKSAGVKVSE